MTTNRFSTIVATTAIAALAILTLSMVRLPGKSVVSNSKLGAYDQVELVRAARYVEAAAKLAYLDQRRGEWMVGQAMPVTGAKLSFRQAEQIAGAADAQRADLSYREGEWNAGVNPAAAYLNYRRGEWTGK